jgi:hypothetical protein
MTQTADKATRRTRPAGLWGGLRTSKSSCSLTPAGAIDGGLGSGFLTSRSSYDSSLLCMGTPGGGLGKRMVASGYARSSSLPGTGTPGGGFSVFRSSRSLMLSSMNPASSGLGSGFAEAFPTACSGPGTWTVDGQFGTDRIPGTGAGCSSRRQSDSQNCSTEEKQC